MAVQDDERERELVRMFNLNWDPAHQRAGVDAILDLEVDGRNCRFEIEVKSTTSTSVSTARDVGIEHIKKWRNKIFVIGFYTKSNRPELISSLCLTPIDMEPWIKGIEEKISIDFKLAELNSKKIDISDLIKICGEKGNYSIKDAKRIHKQQWSLEEYKSAQDVIDGRKKSLSPEKMLEILQLRSKYISERGATLNNPHITKTHLDKFKNTNRVIKTGMWFYGIREIAADFVRSHPNHPSIGDF